MARSTSARSQLLASPGYSQGCLISSDDPIRLRPFPSRGWRRLRVAPVQRPHHPDAREHRRPVMFGDQQQRFHRGLPVGGVVFRFRQRGDVGRGIAQRLDRAPVRQDDRIVELRGPRHSGRHFLQGQACDWASHSDDAVL